MHCVIGGLESGEQRSIKINLDPDLRMFFILPLSVCIGKGLGIERNGKEWSGVEV